MNRHNVLGLLLMLGAVALLGSLSIPSRAAAPVGAASRLAAGGGLLSPTATPTGCPNPPPPAPWAVVSPAPVAAYGISMAGDGTAAYAVGGYSLQSHSQINQFARYNPTTDTWTTLAPIPDLNNGAATSVYSPLDNRLYVFGGEDFAGATVTDTTRSYNLSNGTWAAGPPLPDRRAFMAGGYYNGKIYLVGGYSTDNANPAFTQTWEYSIVSSTWLTKTAVPAPLGFGGAGSGVSNGRLYVAGGRDANNGLLNTLYSYDIAADSWTIQAPLPTADTVPGSAVINGKLWIFGGGTPFTSRTPADRRSRTVPDATTATLIYDPAGNTWTTGPALNTPRSFLGGTGVGSVAVAVGGYTGSTTTASTESSTNPVVVCGTPTTTVTPVIIPTITSTPTTTATASATVTPTGTLTATATPATVTATPCGIRFSDVTDSTSYYYQGVYYLACRGVISGYSDGTYKPFNNTTRGQMTKIVTLAFNIPLVFPPALGNRTFTDVTPADVFYQVIETAAAHGIVSGYGCGGSNPQTGVAEPCDSAQRPYFRPSNFVTRGQLTKIVVIGAGWALRNPAMPTFSDVSTGNVFYPFIETAVCHGVISGYNDGTFRPNAYAFRSQIAKIVYLAVTNPAGSCAPAGR